LLSLIYYKVQNFLTVYPLLYAPTTERRRVQKIFFSYFHFNRLFIFYRHNQIRTYILILSILAKKSMQNTPPLKTRYLRLNLKMCYSAGSKSVGASVGVIRLCAKTTTTSAATVLSTRLAVPLTRMMSSTSMPSNEKLSTPLL